MKRILWTLVGALHFGMILGAIIGVAILTYNALDREFNSEGLVGCTSYVWSDTIEIDCD